MSGEELTPERIMEHIDDRLIKLGNRSRSKKQDAMGRSMAGFACRELHKLKQWIQFGGRKRPLKAQRGDVTE